ncbi:MAG: PqqD family protein [Pseudomonadota bacterium]
MILTAFVSSAASTEDKAAKILEIAWTQVEQPGELVRLCPGTERINDASLALTRSIQTLPWTEHPHINDCYTGYDQSASLLHWLSEEEVDATVLLVDDACLFAGAYREEVLPGQGLGFSWSEAPSGEGPFALSASYEPLRAFCVARDLELPRVQLPLLIHSVDLLKVLPRWLELTAIIRHDVRLGGSDEQILDENATTVALNIAAAEYGIGLRGSDFGGAILHADSHAERYTARYQDLERALTNFDWWKQVVPAPKSGVRQGRVLDQVYLESGWPPQMSQLNSSAAAIWQRCDGQRDLWAIAEELSLRFDVPLPQILPDVTSTALQFRQQGALSFTRRIE